MIRENKRRVTGSRLATRPASCSVSGDVSPVPRPVQCTGGPLEHSGHTDMATVKMFKNFLSQSMGNDRAVVEEDNWSHNDQRVSVQVVRLELHVPITDGVRCSSSDGVMKQLVHSLQPVPGEHCYNKVENNF